MVEKNVLQGVQTESGRKEELIHRMPQQKDAWIGMISLMKVDDVLNHDTADENNDW